MKLCLVGAIDYVIVLWNYCRELGIGIVAYSPLGIGFFGGKGMVESLPSESLLVICCIYISITLLLLSTDASVFVVVVAVGVAQTLHPRFTGENQEKNKAIYTRFASLAAKHSCTPPQLALAWLLHQGDDVVPIPGKNETF